MEKCTIAQIHIRRPISLHPVLLKLSEKFMHNRLKDECDNVNFEEKTQENYILLD